MPSLITDPKFSQNFSYAEEFYQGILNTKWNSDENRWVLVESFKDAAALRRILTNQKSDYFIRCLTEKMLTYALGRGLDYYDRRTVDNIVLRLKKKDYRFNELIVGVVTSLPFDKKRGEAGK